MYRNINCITAAKQLSLINSHTPHRTAFHFSIINCAIEAQRALTTHKAQYLSQPHEQTPPSRSHQVGYAGQEVVPHEEAHEHEIVDDPSDLELRGHVVLPSFLALNGIGKHCYVRGSTVCVCVCVCV
jgi:hypothetical protein